MATEESGATRTLFLFALCTVCILLDPCLVSSAFYQGLVTFIILKPF